MISREQIEKYRVTGMWDDPMHWPEFLDTLDAALKVVEAAKLKVQRHNDNCDAGHKCSTLALVDALTPFTAPRGKE